MKRTDQKWNKEVFGKIKRKKCKCWFEKLKKRS